MCALLAAGAAWAQSDAKVVADGERLVRAGKFADAYVLLLPHEDRLAGDLKFDYLLARSALESGQPSKASFIYERILAVQPNYLGVRLEMGRAYYALGDFARAKLEFETVLRFENLPADLRQQAQIYAGAAEQQLAGKRTVFFTYLEYGYGYDANPQSSTRISVITLAGGGTLILPQTALPQGDHYHALTAGGELVHAFTDQFSMFAGRGPEDAAEIELESRAAAGAEVEGRTEDDRQALDPVVGAAGGEQQGGPHLAGLEAGPGRGKVADRTPAFADLEQPVLGSVHRRGVPENPLPPFMARAQAANEPAPDHQNVPPHVGPGQEVQGAVRDRDGTFDPSRNPEIASMETQPPHEPAAGGEGHIALHPRGGGVVVEIDQLRHDLGWRAHPLQAVGGRGIGIDHDHAVLRPDGWGQHEQEEQSGERSHASPSVVFSTPSRRIRR
jgi:hypothetical protein